MLKLESKRKKQAKKAQRGMKVLRPANNFQPYIQNLENEKSYHQKVSEPRAKALVDAIVSLRPASASYLGQARASSVQLG